MNTKLHAITDANGRPLNFFITAGQISDYTGAAVLLNELPKAQWMLADRAYDADWFRDALRTRGIITALARKLVTIANALCNVRKAWDLQGA